MALSARTPLPLTHLFTVLYTDGTSWTQPLDDAPRTPRTDGTGSAFTDVDMARVSVFFLENDKTLFQVHMDDGHFEINDVVFCVGDDDGIPLGPRRLVYFRRIAHDYVSVVKTGERNHGETRRSYHLGWEADRTDRPGETVRHTIEVGHEVFRP